MATIPTAAPPAGTHQNNNQALTVLTSLFFMMGFITCMNDILVPHLKEVFSLNYAQALLVQFCFFTAYAITSIPFGKFISRLGYKNGVIGGFLIAATGCLLFYPAAGSKSYPIFLGALFILASGVTLLQVSGNPYVTLLSPPGKEARTLTLVQAFNSLGTTVAPSIGALFILSTEIISPDQQKAMSAADLARYQAGQAASVQEPYLILAGILILLAVTVFFIRLPAAEKIAQEVSAHAHDDRTSAWHYHHLKLGTVGIFCYVGAEVAIGSLLVSVMGLPEVAGLKEATAAHYLTYYWGGAMVGRFLGQLPAQHHPAGHLPVVQRPDERAADLAGHRTGRARGHVQPAGLRLLQLHHVPDHLLAGHAWPGAAHQPGLGHAGHGHRRGCHRAAVPGRRG